MRRIAPEDYRKLSAALKTISSLPEIGNRRSFRQSDLRVSLDKKQSKLSIDDGLFEGINQYMDEGIHQ
jgi:hypothetical protein